jgi:glycosyltransferase involved in cell wall biosynthesis
MSVQPCGRQTDILMWGVWPDPRAGGICSVVHDLVKRLNELGRNVILATDVRGLPSLGPERLFVIWAPGDRPFDWRVAVDRGRIYAGFRHLARADRLGTLGGGADRLARVGVIHYHGDAFWPEDSPGGGPGRSHRLDVVASYVAARSGRRPRVVRTRHDDVQGGLDVFMRLTGIDPLMLPGPERCALWGGGTNLEPIVHNHVGRHRAALAAEGWSDVELKRSIHHVAYFLNYARICQREVRQVDAVVCLTDRAAGELAALVKVDIESDEAGGGAILVSIANGSSFEPRSRRRVDDLVDGYRGAPGLVCHRGAATLAERVHLGPCDRIVIFVGRCHRSKGIYELALALRRLYHQNATNLKCVTIKGIFVGDFDLSARRELASTDAERAGDYLLFTGRIGDPDTLASLYALANVTALVSYADAFALVGLESYLMGTPCVVTEGTSMAEVYLERPTREGAPIALGVARPAGGGTHRYFGVDVDSLVHQLNTLIHDEPLARRLGQNGGSYMRKHHSHRRMGNDYEALYNRLLDASKSRP